MSENALTEAQLNRMEEREQQADTVYSLYEHEDELPAVYRAPETPAEVMYGVDAEPAPEKPKPRAKPKPRPDVDPGSIPRDEADLRTEVELASSRIEPQVQRYAQLYALIQAGRIGELSGGDKNKEREIVEVMNTAWSKLQPQLQTLIEARAHLEDVETERRYGSEYQKLVKKLPDVDPKRLQSYLTDTMKFTPEEVALADDYRLFEMAEKARRYDELMANQPKGQKKKRGGKVVKRKGRKTWSESTDDSAIARGVLEEDGLTPSLRGNVFQRRAAVDLLYPEAGKKTTAQTSKKRDSKGRYRSTA